MPKLPFVLTALVLATPAAAQNPCATGPGKVFGVIAYQCASCAVKMYESGHVFEFQAEPVITQVSSDSKLQAGDVVVAVNDQPILTSAGANLFTYPTTGEYTISVRRAGVLVQVPTRTLTCPVVIAAATRHLVEAYFRQLNIRDSTSTYNYYNSRGPGRYGFAVGCVPTCTRTRSASGEEYWKWGGPPPIVSLSSNGPAQQAGLRTGDLIIQVNGVSILTEEGAILFRRALVEDKVRLTVLRDGKAREYSLTLPRP